VTYGKVHLDSANQENMEQAHQYFYIGQVRRKGNTACEREKERTRAGKHKRSTSKMRTTKYPAKLMLFHSSLECIEPLVMNTCPLHSFDASIGNFARMSDIWGRANGSEYQHDKQIFHHSSVNRKQVASSEGRSGWPLCMRMIRCGSVLTSEKGRCRVKSSLFRDIQ